jgi:hypothetical protein
VRISLEEGEKKDAITPMANSTNKKKIGMNLWHSNISQQGCETITHY